MYFNVPQEQGKGKNMLDFSLGNIKREMKGVIMSTKFLLLLYLIWTERKSEQNNSKTLNNMTLTNKEPPKNVQINLIRFKEVTGSFL